MNQEITYYPCTDTSCPSTKHVHIKGEVVIIPNDRNDIRVVEVKGLSNFAGK